jgi:hypothetical protein
MHIIKNIVAASYMNIICNIYNKDYTVFYNGLGSISQYFTMDWGRYQYFTLILCFRVGVDILH